MLVLRTLSFKAYPNLICTSSSVVIRDGVWNDESVSISIRVIVTAITSVDDESPILGVVF